MSIHLENTELMEALEAHGLPVTVLLTKGDGQFDPYLLQRVV